MLYNGVVPVFLGAGVLCHYVEFTRRRHGLPASDWAQVIHCNCFFSYTDSFFTALLSRTMLFVNLTDNHKTRNIKMKRNIQERLISKKNNTVRIIVNIPVLIDCCTKLYFRFGYFGINFIHVAKKETRIETIITSIKKGTSSSPVYFN